ncbi:hypothetical protein [Muricoccus radiodurans]|uniref:hypothetical protein n=1 Tax=Muricoccus radiodurans TaxID=2231721 RepID=UPI003CF8F8A5
MDEERPVGALGVPTDQAERLAELRRLANITENNLAVWQALSLHLGGREALDAYDRTKVADGEMVPIPRWCAQYLLSCALNIQELSDQHFQRHITRKSGLSLKDVRELLPRAMQLSGAGWNAFGRMVSTWESLQDWRMAREVREQGKSAAEATERVRKFRGLGSGPKDQRAAARRIAAGRKLEEKLTKPHP